jgi:MHS family citrate/tricarballylate:H+ symporter-like MFS transporter
MRMSQVAEGLVAPPEHTTPKRRHIAAATIGNALEFYDFLIYTFFSIQIGHAFFPAQSAYGSLMLSLATFGAGFVTRPIGAVVIGRYADRAGRRPAMMLCFVLIGVAIVGMAVIPTYASIGIAAPILAVIARMVQGFSLGGEIGSTTAYLMESAPANRRGFNVSWQGASQNMALIAGASVGVLLTTLLPPDALDAYGWRIAFLFGAFTVPFGFWMRRNLPETMEKPSAAARPAPHAPSGLGLARAHWRVIVLGFTVLASGTITVYIFNYMVTYAQATLHMSARVGFVAATLGYLLGIPCTLLGGALSDRHGRWPINVWGNFVFILLIYPAFAWATATGSELAFVLAMTLLSAVAKFSVGSVYAALVESLPTAIRCSGFGTVYSLSIAIFGGTTQLVVTWLIHVTGSPMAPAWYMIAAAVTGQIAVMLLTESAPVRLAFGRVPAAAMG